MTDITIDELADLLIEDGATCVVQYGSSLADPETANDIDLFAIYPDDAGSHLQLGPFDIIRLTESKFDYYRDRRNPVYCTEPCLTGAVIAGDETSIEETKSQIRDGPPPQRAINHNLNRSLEAFADCVDALSSNAVEYTVDRFHFVVTYWLFASWYATGNPTRPLSTVREETQNTEFVDRIFDFVDAKRSQQSLKPAEVATLIEEWQVFMLTDRFDCQKIPDN